MKEKSLDKCTGCSICALNCPVKAINDNMCFEENINMERCIDCGLCHRLCSQENDGKDPTLPDGSLDKSKWEHPEFDAKLCTGCRLCVENCPTNSLDLTAPKEHGDIHTKAYLADPDTCIGCALCEKHCPVSAIKMAKKK